VVLDAGSLRDPRIQDEDIEPIAHRTSHLVREFCSGLGGGQVGADHIGFAAVVTNRGHQRIRILLRLSKMHEHAGTRGRQCQRGGAADSTRGPSYQGSLFIKVKDILLLIL